MLVALALDAAAAADAARLDAALGTPLSGRRSPSCAVIDASGAHAQVEEVIGELADRAVAALGRADLDAHARCCASWRPRPPSARSDQPAPGLCACRMSWFGTRPRHLATHGCGS